MKKAILIVVLIAAGIELGCIGFDALQVQTMSETVIGDK